ncbi:MAG: hypothetical protein JSW05_00115 [Candidatus Thorarchaeota archaeon]|nr:MAG: hypothetical protein JSW05_00115 [Candidatus Thorarchaeota archaeon]
MTYTKKELRNYLKDLLKGKAELADFSFEYQSGHTAYYSRLRITVTSDKIVHWKIPKGTPVDIKKETKAAKKRDIAFSNDKLSVFIQELVKTKIWDLENCSERALPNAAVLTFSIRDNDHLLFEQKVWESCRFDDKKTKELLRTIAANIPLDWTPP